MREEIVSYEKNGYIDRKEGGVKKIIRDIVIKCKTDKDYKMQIIISHIGLAATVICLVCVLLIIALKA